MVLAFRIALRKHLPKIHEMGYTVEFLSCGTDGIDGPTDAAGAVWNVSNDFKVEGDALEEVSGQRHLDDNDSYAYWEKVGGLVKTGHTGTNVMDIQVLIVKHNHD